MPRLPLAATSARTAAGLAAVVLCAAVLASRIRTLANEPRVALGRRVVQLMDNRTLALRVQAYARTYGRPAYYLDSVEAHLDSADRRHVSELRTDLWGDSVAYSWSFCDFTVVSHAGWRPEAPSPSPVARAESDSIWRPAARQGLRGPTSEIVERYAWPDGVGRTRDCYRAP